MKIRLWLEGKIPASMESDTVFTLSSSYWDPECALVVGVDVTLVTVGCTSKRENSSRYLATSTRTGSRVWKERRNTSPKRQFNVQVSSQ